MESVRNKNKNKDLKISGKKENSETISSSEAKLRNHQEKKTRN